MYILYGVVQNFNHQHAAMDGLLPQRLMLARTLQRLPAFDTLNTSTEYELDILWTEYWEYGIGVLEVSWALPTSPSPSHPCIHPHPLASSHCKLKSLPVSAEVHVSACTKPYPEVLVPEA